MITNRSRGLQKINLKKKSKKYLITTRFLGMRKQPQEKWKKKEELKPILCEIGLKVGVAFDMGVIRVPRSARRRPRYKSEAWQPIPKTGLRGDDGWNRGDRVRAAVADESVFSDEIETDELLVSIDDVDDEDKCVNGASACPLPIKPLHLIGVAKLKPFCWNARGCGTFRGFEESNDNRESDVFHLSIYKWDFQ